MIKQIVTNCQRDVTVSRHAIAPATHGFTELKGEKTRRARGAGEGNTCELHRMDCARFNVNKYLFALFINYIRHYPFNYKI